MNPSAFAQDPGQAGAAPETAGPGTGSSTNAARPDGEPAAAPAAEPTESGVEIVPLPLTGPAYLLAQKAYAELDAGDYDAAIAHTREALRQRPDVQRLKYLLVDALVAAGRRDEAEAAIEGYLASTPSDTRLQETLAMLRAGPEGPTPAFLAARDAYAAYAARKYERAVARAEDALRLDPGNAAYRKLLANAKAAIVASRPDPSFVAAQAAYRAYDAGRYDEAISSARTAVRLAPGNRGYSLLLADALSAAGHPDQSLAVLGTLPDPDRYDVVSRMAVAEADLENWTAAASAYRQARLVAPNETDRATAVAGEIRATAAAGDKAAAARLFDEANAAGALAALSDLDRAYTAANVGRDAAALAAFDAAREAGKVHGTVNFDAAYAAKHAFQNADAVGYFKSGIDDAVAAGQDINDPTLFAIRRDVSDLTRVWGAYLTLSHAPLGAAQAGSGVSSFTNGSAITQLGAEVFWRPPVIGYRDGALFEFFARDFITLHDESGGPTGFSTQQGMVGARWKPLKDWNLVFEVAKLVKLGSDARNDTVLRTAFSEGMGTDLRVDVPSWWMWQVYGEVDYYLENPQTIALADARVGRSFRLDGISDRLVATPFVGISESYDSSLATAEALGAGPGIALRYWFREDTYNAPRSYVDASIRYHAKLTGDDRAEGLFGGITFYY
ncbi:Flp pilus assembly protein TadD [Amorphus suaedae]